MAMKTYRPITPSLRYITTADFSALTPKKKLKRNKKLVMPLSESGGRNNNGRITIRHRGGGHKRQYRVVDFRRNKLEIPATVLTLEYDPNRTAYIARVGYKDGEQRYILAPQGLKVGDTIFASDKADIKPGNHMSLAALPVGTLIHNIELEPGKGSKVVRSAGAAAQLMGREGTYAQVKMPSGEMRLIHVTCRATVGQVSNAERENITIGKAGRSRWLGKRPRVRGVAMNPIDHPMGGGEGKATGGHPRSPWGTPAKGYKTRVNKRTDAFILKRRK